MQLADTLQGEITETWKMYFRCPHFNCCASVIRTRIKNFVCVKDEKLVKQDLIFDFCFARCSQALESGLLFMFVQHLLSFSLLR